MVSVRSAVFNVYNQNNSITLSELKEMFKATSKEVLSVYLSDARKGNILNNINSINISTLEPMIIKLLNKSPNTTNLKLALDLLKAKIADKGMDDDLDVSKYIILGKKYNDSTEATDTIQDEVTHSD